MNPHKSILVFVVNQSEYCLDLEKVQAVLTVDEYEDHSGTPQMEDFISFDGKEVIYLPFRNINDYPAASDSTRLIVFEEKERSFALWADFIKEIRILDAEEDERFRNIKTFIYN